MNKKISFKNKNYLKLAQLFFIFILSAWMFEGILQILYLWKVNSITSLLEYDSLAFWGDKDSKEIELTMKKAGYFYEILSITIYAAFIYGLIFLKKWILMPLFLVSFFYIFKIVYVPEDLLYLLEKEHYRDIVNLFFMFIVHLNFILCIIILYHNRALFVSNSVENETAKVDVKRK